MLLTLIRIISATLAIGGYLFGLYDKFFDVIILYVVIAIELILLWVISCFVATRFIRMRKDYKEDNRLFRFYVNCIIDSVPKLLKVKLHITGKECLPEEKFLLVCNHNGAMDPLVTMNVLKDYKMGFVARHEVYKIPILSRLMHRCNCPCLNRNSLADSAKTIAKASYFIKEDKASMGIYPEGTRNRKKEMLPFMNGAFKIAKKAKCPIVVATIRNTENVMRNALFKGTDVYLDFIGVLDKEFVMNNKTPQISETARQMMEESFAENTLAN